MDLPRTPKRRAQPVLLVCDTSGSMQGAPLAALQFFLQELLPHLRQRAAASPHLEVSVEALTYASKAQWQGSGPTPAADFQPPPLVAGGDSALGSALVLLEERLARPPRRGALPPLLILMTDGYPTDGWRPMLTSLAQTPRFASCLRALISFGPDLCLDLIEEFLAPRLPLPRRHQTAHAWFPLPGAREWTLGSLHHPELLLDALPWDDGSLR
jgi:uncharacterized protein YegL